jgi:hypothetical protein
MIGMLRGARGFCLLIWAAMPALASAGIWQDLSVQTNTASKGVVTEGAYYRALEADEAMLRQALSKAPLERTSTLGADLELPMPDGENQQFEVLESPILSDALMDRYPDVATYSVIGVDNPAISGRLDITPSGFHAMLSTPSGTVFVDPDSSGNYRSYYKQDYAQSNPDVASEYVCKMHELEQTVAEESLNQLLARRSVSTNSRRVYRLALVTTGEYGSYFGSSSEAADSVVTIINRVNQIYGRDLAVQLKLVEILAYTDPDSDPFDDPTDVAVSGLLPENQEILDFEVGLDNYDIGHLFGTTGGGLAMLGSACTTVRAQGYTGHPTPDVGDPFAIDFVAHEMGHQLNATHSFNGTTLNCSAGNREASTAVEPGSGSTIMAYAGICGGENLQSNSDATFHTVNIRQINSFVFNGTGSSCGSLTATGNSLPATISAGDDVTIPIETPFVLTGSADEDPDGDSLSYQWDQIDVDGTATSASTVDEDLGDNPLFRSFVPKSTPTRYFPRLSTLIEGNTDIGETLPSTLRELNFRMTVRDGQSGVGDDDVTVTTDISQGPFRITGGVLNESNNLVGNSTQTLTWDVADTDTDCPNVSISLLSLSEDGSTYCDKDDDDRLQPDNGSGIDNIGSASVTLPSAQIARARVMLSCDNNVFFALSENDFAVTSGGSQIASDCKAVDGESLEHGTIFVDQSVSGGNAFSGDGGGGALFALPLMLLFSGLLRLFARYSARTKA